MDFDGEDFGGKREIAATRVVMRGGHEIRTVQQQLKVEDGAGSYSGLKTKDEPFCHFSFNFNI